MGLGASLVTAQAFSHPMSKSPTGCLPHPRFYTLNSFNAWLRSTLCRDCHMAKNVCVIRSTHPNGTANPVGLFPDPSGRQGVATGLSRMRAPWTSPGKLPHRPLGVPQPPVDPRRSNDPTHRNGIRGALPDSVRLLHQMVPVRRVKFTP
jgi:hypothetical protein